MGAPSPSCTGRNEDETTPAPRRHRSAEKAGGCGNGDAVTTNHRFDMIKGHLEKWTRIAVRAGVVYKKTHFEISCGFRQSCPRPLGAQVNSKRTRINVVSLPYSVCEVIQNSLATSHEHHIDTSIPQLVRERCSYPVRTTSDYRPGTIFLGEHAENLLFSSRIEQRGPRRRRGHIPPRRGRNRCRSSEVVRGGRALHHSGPGLAVPGVSDDGLL